MALLYRVVLIFPDIEQLTEFVLAMEVPGHVSGSECIFAGTLSEEQIIKARRLFKAYVKLIKEVKK